MTDQANLVLFPRFDKMRGRVGHIVAGKASGFPILEDAARQFEFRLGGEFALLVDRRVRVHDRMVVRIEAFRANTGRN